MPVFLQYVNQSPVARWTGNVMEHSSATGEARLDLKFQMPLNHAIDTRAQGAFHFANNDVDLLPDLPLLYRTTGKVEFNEHGFTLNGVRGQFLGDSLAISGGTQKDGSSQVRLEGGQCRGAAQAIHRAFAAAPAGTPVGSARYTATVQVRQRQPEVSIESNLAGWGWTCRALAQGRAGQPAAALDLLPLASSDPLIEREELRVALGQNISTRHVRERVVPVVPTGVLPVAASAGTSRRRRRRRLKLALATDSLDLDAWLALKNDLVGKGSSSPAAAGGAPGQQ
jgi:uncharacterized protein YhdP